MDLPINQISDSVCFPIMAVDVGTKSEWDAAVEKCYNWLDSFLFL